jgi:hypothetical protein
MNTELLQFLDGTLAPEQEAELLHRLSVSPERRDLLRSYFNQQQLFQRDRNSIAVPYAAEQKLWASLGAMMPPAVQNAAAPAAAVIETAATTASRTGFFNSAFSVASVALICLLIGLGSGYFAGKNSNTDNIVAENAPVGRTLSPSLTMSKTPEMGHIGQIERIVDPISNAKNNYSFSKSQNIVVPNPGAPLETETIANANGENIAHADITMNNSGEETTTNSFLPEISSVTPKQIADANINIAHMHDPWHYAANSPFDMDESSVQSHKSFIQEFEFYFNTGIGKQFPNNAATNVSMPVVTNSSISFLWQGLANTPGVLSHLWIGGSFGTANVTQKKLRLDLDPVAKSYVMMSDPVHVQTTWYGGMLQYRVAASRKIAFTATGTIGNSSVGRVLGAELGMHVDATSDVGFVLGLRGIHISYSVDQQQQDLINQGKTLGLSVPGSSLGNQLSYNIEGSLGVYFHF